MSAAVGVVVRGQGQALSALAEAVSKRQDSLPWLLEAAQAGDADAFASLVRHFQGPIYQFILRMVHRPAVAEDLAQDVFIRLWRHLAEMESAAMVEGWLRRVAANAVIDHWRQEEVRERRLRILREHPVARHVLKPSSRMESREALGAVQAALGALPSKLRSVLVLRTVECLSYEQLAEVLGISTHAVRSRLFRARHEFHELLKHGKAADYLARMYRPGRQERAP